MGIKMEKLQSWSTSTRLKFMVLVIGPDEARELLLHNDKNRPLSDITVARYAKAMHDDGWALTGESLIFSDTGRLLNGQHRLHAIIKSKSVIETAAIFGVSEEAFDKIDAGRKRSVADLLAERGIPNNKNVAAAVASLCEMKAGAQGIGVTNLRNFRQNTLTSVTIGVDNQKQLVAAARLCAQHPAVKLVNGATIAVLACMIASGKEGVAGDFVSKIASGEGITRGDPELAFRKKVMDAKMRGADLEQSIQLAFLIKCAIAKLKGAKIITLSFSEGDAFPVMPGLELLNIPEIQDRCTMLAIG